MNLNSLKGILVLLVILDHNDFARSIIPGFLAGFTFHVVGFLTIPFLRSPVPWSRDTLTYLFRLYFPFLAIVTSMAIVVAWTTPVSASEQLRLWLIALYSGNFDILKQVTHMALLWFIPSFIALIILRTVTENSSALGKALLMVLFVSIHPFVGLISPEIRNTIPLGLLPALYVIPLAYLGVLIQRNFYERVHPFTALLISGAIFAATKYAQIRAELSTEVGFVNVADYRTPYALFVNDLEAVFGVVMLFQLARFPLGSFLELCGKYSLQIYLFHAFVALFIYEILKRLATDWSVAALFLVSLSMTILATATIARYVAELSLTKRFLFPASPAALLGRAATQHATPARMPSSSVTNSDIRQ